MTTGLAIIILTLGRPFYQENLNCPLLCLIDGATTYEDTQQHLMSCKTIFTKS